MPAMRGAKPKQDPEELVDRIRVLYAEGKTQAEVGQIVDLSQKVVWRIMVRHGIQARVAAKRDQRGSLNSSWKGDKATYAALHYRVAAARGQPQRCEVCGTTDPSRNYDWANLTGHYEDLSDYRRMCRSCHWRHDGIVRNLHRGGDA